MKALDLIPSVGSGGGEARKQQRQTGRHTDRQTDGRQQERRKKGKKEEERKKGRRDREKEKEMG